MAVIKIQFIISLHFPTVLFLWDRLLGLDPGEDQAGHRPGEEHEPHRGGRFDE